MRALMRLPAHPARMFTTDEIATVVAILRNHLTKVVRPLDARQALFECFRADGGACALTLKCRLKGKLVKARDAFVRERDATTLAESIYFGARKRRVTKTAWAA
ncbi:MAG: hypothetical protein ACLPGW_07715 [Roseiarcus sp.]